MSKKIEIRVSGPLGPSEKGRGFGTDWNNMSMATDGPATCEICGKKYPVRKEQSYLISRFLGRSVVEECCGAILDIAYAESKRSFMEALLEEFAENPAAVEFYTLRSQFVDSLTKARKNITDTGKQVEKALEDATKVKKG